MPAVVRESDAQVGICQRPSTPFTQNGVNDKSYSPNVFVNSKPSVRMGDKGSTNCGYGGEYEIISGSPNVFINSLPAVGVGATAKCGTCQGIGSITSGSSNVFMN